ncbi:MAG: NAD(+) synthase [Candidatus Yanofskybacteria bacterium RIFCSPHIGHO2_02_FULL_44_12b]|uniref:Glutamine-dependent NAD(+) synthetase n=2 Tax=Candidatus Yanofskyibacteriota TaxID=1752733 RepID=A0A1F8GLB4_9BACT|nr:MAG: NAD+ synthase [Candidatus Yanofskybacteria bacterium GW2011_GWA2_44_9]OGN04412.1 MAG: NAD(+) synthase [Candidatus Yanofskybacteria bacterium RIFCSPHIGHO2_01_FULL_44_24]OGN14494.1 MAG: NAD(+) synthase [Candidatus Yanofskybacteria bacterium RIFCSPHIGHO2_02_FULL_44_12b]OGN25800.1 MAG: NAD(+) synthase [Candidatus Yanofskybacteria bacterium RIFCSPLOWO2_01_FULL_44_22]
MRNLDGLKLSLCQMKVVPGRPDINTEYVLKEIKAASGRGTDILIFPELCISGYLIGDMFEDEGFIGDIQFLNDEIVKSVPLNMTVIFGSVVTSTDRGEDGRRRIYNAAIVAQNGRQLGYVVKTLQPHYRYFDDDKHLYSSRKIAEESAELYRKTGGKSGIENCSVRDLLKVFNIETSIGTVPLGIGICEDFWKEDYSLNPAGILVKKGAELLIAISASPWGWHKNRKRHQVIRKGIEEWGVPLVYVNNTGGQNNGDNVINFDGVSTIYNQAGDIVYEEELYFSGTRDITWNSISGISREQPADDTKELYLGIRSATNYMLNMLPDKRRHVVIGLSGGIDSATVAALMVDILGPDRVHLVNMPYEYSDPGVQALAVKIATNLGCKLEVIPIGGIVDAIAQSTGVDRDTPAHANIQARCRMEILAAEAQKLGGVFTCNANKVEIAFGYGTLDGDMRGWLIPFGDLLKREVRQLAGYFNSFVFKREVIPSRCIEQIPSAELEENQKDPFDYGYPDKRGYHDEWVRAVTEFRWNAERFLDAYMKGSLESELMLEPDTLKKLFPDRKDFIADLERCWKMYQYAFLKRVQAPPIIVVSRRAFGRDLEESLMSPHYTQRYLYLKDQLLGIKS